MALFAEIPWQGWPGRGSIGREFLEANPQAAYQRLLEQMGLGGMVQSPYARYAQGLGTESYNTYLGGLAGVPNPEQYSYSDFLADYWKPKLPQGWGGLTASQRNERYPGGVGRGRWVGWAS